MKGKNTSKILKSIRKIVWVDEQDGEAIELAFGEKNIEAMKNYLQQFEVKAKIYYLDKFKVCLFTLFYI